VPYSRTTVANSKSSSEIANILRAQAEALQFLIDEAQRIQRDITEHLTQLRHAGDPERRKNPR